MAYNQIRLGFNQDDEVDMEAYHYLHDLGNKRNKYIVKLVSEDKNGMTEINLLKIHETKLEKIKEMTEQLMSSINTCIDNVNEELVFHKHGILNINELILVDTISEIDKRCLEDFVQKEITYNKKQLVDLENLSSEMMSKNEIYELIKACYIKNLTHAKVIEHILESISRLKENEKVDDS